MSNKEIRERFLDYLWETSELGDTILKNQYSYRKELFEDFIIDYSDDIKNAINKLYKYYKNEGKIKKFKINDLVSSDEFLDITDPFIDILLSIKKEEESREQKMIETIKWNKYLYDLASHGKIETISKDNVYYRLIKQIQKLLNNNKHIYLELLDKYINDDWEYIEEYNFIKEFKEKIALHKLTLYSKIKELKKLNIYKFNVLLSIFKKHKIKTISDLINISRKEWIEIMYEYVAYITGIPMDEIRIRYANIQNLDGEIIIDTITDLAMKLYPKFKLKYIPIFRVLVGQILYKMQESDETLSDDIIDEWLEAGFDSNDYKMLYFGPDIPEAPPAPIPDILKNIGLEGKERKNKLSNKILIKYLERFISNISDSEELSKLKLKKFVSYLNSNGITNKLSKKQKDLISNIVSDRYNELKEWEKEFDEYRSRQEKNKWEKEFGEYSSRRKERISKIN